MQLPPSLAWASLSSAYPCPRVLSQPHFAWSPGPLPVSALVISGWHWLPARWSLTWRKYFLPARPPLVVCSNNGSRWIGDERQKKEKKWDLCDWQVGPGKVGALELSPKIRPSYFSGHCYCWRCSYKLVSIFFFAKVIITKIKKVWLYIFQNLIHLSWYRVMCIRAVVALFTLLILLVLLVLVPLLVNTYAGFRIAIGIYIIGTIFLSEPHN